MAVRLTAAEIGKLSPAAQAQIAAANPKKLHAVQPEERPAATPQRRRMNPRKAVAGVRTAGRYAARGNRAGGRGLRAVSGGVSIEGIFGVITGAALAGALLYRSSTITGLLGHMTAYWQKVIALGKAA